MLFLVRTQSHLVQVVGRSTVLSDVQTFGFFLGANTHTHDEFEDEEDCESEDERKGTHGERSKQLGEEFVLRVE